MPSRLLDFKDLRARASFARVFDAYGIELKKDGTRPGQFKALCPFHEDTNPSLKVNTDKNVYHCFACDAKGNVIDFVMAMDGTAIRPAAMKVASICGIDTDTPLPRPKAGTEKPASAPKGATTGAVKPPAPATPEPGAEEEPLGPNKPLGFVMKLEDTPELTAWLTGRGLDAGAVATFGLGQASAKSKSIGGRLAIPLHNAGGELIGYCGRYIGDVVPDDQPKYIMPKGFRKELELFNLHRVKALSPAPRYVVLFESFLSVMRHAAHVPAVSPMGRTMLPPQVELLCETGIDTVIVVFDGDDPGRAGGRETAALLAPHLWVRVVDLPVGQKPHQLSWEELRPHLRAAWRKVPDAP